MERLFEASTWKGFALILGSISSIFMPALAEPIAAVTIAIYGVVDVLRKESTNS